MLEKIELIHYNFDFHCVQHFIFNANIIGFTTIKFTKQKVFQFTALPENNKDFSNYLNAMPGRKEVIFYLDGTKYYAELGYQVEKNQINLGIVKEFYEYHYDKQQIIDFGISS